MLHSFAVTYLMRAQTSMSALFPSGKPPTTRVRRRISRLSRSIILFVRILLRRPSGNSGSRYVVVSPIPLPQAVGRGLQPSAFGLATMY